MRAREKIDMWCVDGASTTFATFDRTRCSNIRPCSVTIFGQNDEDTFVCKELGDCSVDTYDKQTGKVGKMLAVMPLSVHIFPSTYFL